MRENRNSGHQLYIDVLRIIVTRKQALPRFNICPEFLMAALRHIPLHILRDNALSRSNRNNISHTGKWKYERSYPYTMYFFIFAIAFYYVGKLPEEKRVVADLWLRANVVMYIAILMLTNLTLFTSPYLLSAEKLPLSVTPAFPIPAL